MRNRVVRVQDIQAVLLGDLHDGAGHRQVIGRILEQGIGAYLDLVIGQVAAIGLKAKWHGIADDVYVVTAFSQSAAEFGGNYA